jgi:hypothetical protein
LPGIRHPEGVVEGGGGVRVGEAVEVPVCLFCCQYRLLSLQSSGGWDERGWEGCGGDKEGKLTCELNIIGVFFVVANATILKSHVIWPKLYVT